MWTRAGANYLLIEPTAKMEITYYTHIPLLLLLQYTSVVKGRAQKHVQITCYYTTSSRLGRSLYHIMSRYESVIYAQAVVIVAVKNLIAVAIKRILLLSVCETLNREINIRTVFQISGKKSTFVNGKTTISFFHLDPNIPISKRSVV